MPLREANFPLRAPNFPLGGAICCSEEQFCGHGRRTAARSKRRGVDRPGRWRPAGFQPAADTRDHSPGNDDRRRPRHEAVDHPVDGRLPSPIGRQRARRPFNRSSHRPDETERVDQVSERSLAAGVTGRKRPITEIEDGELAAENRTFSRPVLRLLLPTLSGLADQRVSCRKAVA